MGPEMGWFRQILQWLTGAVTPEPISPAASARSRVGTRASTTPETDPYFTETSGPEFTKAKSLGLESAAFLPISRDELKKAVERQGFSANPWLGRRDRIPPADDSRTELIDRAMATQGIITPEAIVQIHRIGDEMEIARPSIEGIAHQANLAGEAAVHADREARARLKAQKQQVAAERRQRRQAAIAHRRASDIVFLGRGVSRRLSDRTSDPSRLASAGLPVLSTPADLAQASAFRSPVFAGSPFTPTRPRVPTTSGSPSPNEAAEHARSFGRIALWPQPSAGFSKTSLQNCRSKLRRMASSPDAAY